MSAGPYDAERPPPLDFERWADLSAELLGRDPDEQLDRLEAHAIDPELWHACNGFWIGELAAQIARGNLKLAQRYGRRCADELSSRAAVVATEPARAVDQTAFMVALADDTAIPFGRGRAPTVRPPAPPEPAAPQPAAGDTLVAATVAVADPVPFGRR